ncbi:MAG: terpene cyclase/mutase family protein [Kiritimatiellae bacterium]|nr:terpene cyclase/mutase family protein [Kiritimatiellia bacterium]
MSSEPNPVETASAEEKPRRRLDPRLQLIIDHLWGPTGSVILHIIVVIFLINLVITPQKIERAEIEVQVIEPEESKLEEFKKELEQLQDIEVDIKPPEAEMVAEQPPEMDQPTANTPNDELAALDISSDVQSPLIMKGLLAGRTASGRMSALSKYNRRFAGETEQAVIKALEWLKNHQLQDGSWLNEGGSRNAVAMTGLGLLCFLAHGETPATSERYGPTVDRAIKFLISKQKEDGSFDGNSYANGIAVYAISEAYALTRIPSLRTAMEKGIERIIRGMQDTGGFTYGYEKNGRRDTSVAGWQAQAMKAAYIAGADVPGLAEALQRCANGFKMNYIPEQGRFRYAPQPGKAEGSNPTLACTGIGTLCLQLLGHASSPEVEGALKTLEQHVPNYKAPEGTTRPLYSWYYITQAMFHKGRGTWDRWNNTFAREMVQNQNEDGSWVSTGKEEVDYGKVYGTTFSALSLMVYYRFLPTYQPIAVEEKPTEKSKDDVMVEVI